jgi:hypothetical protein
MTAVVVEALVPSVCFFGSAFESKRRYNFSLVMSSEVETSLNISVLTAFSKTEIVRDSSTAVGMTRIEA